MHQKSITSQRESSERLAVTADEMRLNPELWLCAATENMRDSDENYCAESGSGEGKKETASEDAELGEDPAADERANQTKDDVGDAAEAASARELTGEPAGDKAEEQPGDNAAGPPLDNYNVLIHMVSKIAFCELIEV